MSPIDLIWVVNGLQSKITESILPKLHFLLISSSTQENVTSLLQELQLETYAQYHTGKSIAELHRRIRQYSLTVPYISLLSLLESIYNVFRVRNLINDYYSTIPFDFYNSLKV